MKKKLLILGVIILVIINISALITIFHNRRFRPPERPSGPPRSLDFLRHELALSDSQIAQLQAQRATFDKQIDEFRLKLQKKREALVEELRSDEPDSGRIDQLVEEIGELQIELEKKAIRGILQGKAILTPEQREKLLQMFEHRLQGRGMIPAHRWPKGKGPHRDPFGPEENR